jgi:BirA family transcriptional regulator, biotin operon repressor / biotin---[acetyl-CoA-carboxylase] ligase
LFNLEEFDIKLNTDFIGRNFIYADEIDSTNSLLLDKKNKFNSNGTVLLAEKQNKGRGRKDRAWYSAKGQNLTFSILLTNKKFDSNELNFINFVSCISVAVAIESLFQIKTELKWPNDVLSEGKKLAGILLESSSQGDKIDRVVIGIGINVNQTQFQGQYNIEPTSIKIEAASDIQVNREMFLAEVLNIFESELSKIENDKKSILNEYRHRCSMIGARISVSDGTSSKNGIFEDIDENGFILLRTKNKTETIHSGDVTLR